MKELSNAMFRLAVVTLKEICEESAPLQVAVTNGETTCMTDCFVGKSRCSELVVSCTLPALRVFVKSKSCIAILQLWQTWMDQKDWNSFESNPRASFMNWLSESCAVNHLDVLRPTMISSRTCAAESSSHVKGSPVNSHRSPVSFCTASPLKANVAQPSKDSPGTRAPSPRICYRA